MGKNPLNLAFRFLLELCALVIFGLWGWNSTTSALRYLLVATLPLLAAVLWGTFNVPDDPSRSGKAPVPVSGFLRFTLELAFFALAVLVLCDLGWITPAWIFSAAVLVHYALSYDRIAWLLKQKKP